MTPKAETWWDEFKATFDDSSFHPMSSADAIDQLGPRVVISPASATDVARALGRANSLGLRIAPRGSGTKMSWGNTPQGVDIILSTKRLDHVIEHAWADMTVTVEAGCTLANVQTILAAHGQQLALDALWPRKATIGGVLATNDSGTLRSRYGSLRDLVIGMTVALPSGTLAKSGGKVVKNVAGYDLAKLMTGALGTLGVIVEATFRLHPLPFEVLTVSLTAETFEALTALLLAIHDSTLDPSGVQIRANSSGSSHLDVRFEGSSLGAIEAQIDQLLRLRAGIVPIESPPATWNARETLLTDSENTLICKFVVLPSQLSELHENIRRVTSDLLIEWELVQQGSGIGALRLGVSDAESALNALESLWAVSQRLGGSLVVLHCPPEIKAQIDVWGPTDDSLQLMRAIKAQFDPRGVLNPGRFVGRI